MGATGETGRGALFELLVEGASGELSRADMLCGAWWAGSVGTAGFAAGA